MINFKTSALSAVTEYDEQTRKRCEEYRQEIEKLKTKLAKSDAKMKKSVKKPEVYRDLFLECRNIEGEITATESLLAATETDKETAREILTESYRQAVAEYKKEMQPKLEKYYALKAELFSLFQEITAAENIALEAHHDALAIYFNGDSGEFNKRFKNGEQYIDVVENGYRPEAARYFKCFESMPVMFATDLTQR